MSSTSRAGSFDQFLGVTEPWQITVLRSQNLGVLRSEKSWRPIVTVEVDGQHKHEVVLGVDGQNPNQREITHLHHAHHRTQIKLDVWHKPQSKTKSRRKRRRLVASAAVPLGEAMKKQGTDPYVELRLSGVHAARSKSTSHKYRPCASLLIRLRAPPSLVLDDDEDEDVSLVSSDDVSLSDTLVTPVTDDFENAPPWASGVSEEPPSGLRRRKNVQGYCIDSDEERPGESDCCLSEAESDTTKACDFWKPSTPTGKSPIPPHFDTLEIRAYTRVPPTVSVIFPSCLPLTHVAESVSITSCTSFASRAFDMLTYHRELREANVDSDFDPILGRLASEWNYIGASLLSIAAVNTSVFGFSSSELFIVDSFAKRSLIISAVAAAIGLFIDMWFIFAYSGADVRKFKTLAADIYGSYFFFALSSRLPLIALIVSVLAAAGFLGAVAWAAWPTAVLVMCGIAGVLVGLQFIVYFLHCLALCLTWIFRGAWWGAVCVGGQIRAMFTRGQAQDPVELSAVTALPASMRAAPQSGSTT